MSRFFIFLAILFAQVVRATVYEVGPGKTNASIGAVAWESLRAGDTVLIYYRTNAYQEKWVICRQGTETAPITVRGVPGPNGELPMIDGAGATTRSRLNYWGANRGVIKIGGANVPADTKPRYITIENLDIRGARPPNSFYLPNTTVQAYGANAASIWIEKGENITIRNCTLHDNGNGFFVSSGDVATTNVLVDGCYIFDNGNVNSIYEHNVYTEALGITYQFNRFGPLRTGCLGNNLKDRSAGLVVRYNWIEGGSRELDLVDAEDSWAVASHPSYRQTFVYGNVIIEPTVDSNKQIVHYGGDSGVTSLYRKGMLYFFNNTVVSKRTDSMTLFKFDTNDEQCDARNNIFHATVPTSSIGLIDALGILRLSHNWIRQGYKSSFSATAYGAIYSDGTTLTGATPGFVDQTNDDFQLAGTSVCRNAGTDLNTNALPTHVVVSEYLKHQSSQPRWDDGVLDIGAFEYASPESPAIVSEPASRTNVAGTTATFSVSFSGNFPLTFQWLKGSDNLIDGGNVFGATTATLTLTNVAPADAADYSVQITNAFGAIQSLPATLTVLTKPAILTQPQNQSSLIGTPAIFNVSATGGNLHYQWKKGTNFVDSARIAGATTDSLTILGVGATDVSTNYTVTITNAAGLITSTRAGLTVLFPPVITKPPTNLSVIFNSNAIFRVTATGTAPLTYQWFKDGNPLVNGGKISGATSTNLVILAATTSESGNYSVAVSNPYGTATNADVALTIVPYIVIDSPAGGSSFTNPVITVMGRAGDVGSGVSQVVYQLNGSAFQPAIGTTNWKAPISLQTGTNFFFVKSINGEGKESAVPGRSYFLIVYSPLTLMTNGIGGITGATNGQKLLVGRNYTLTATPGAGQILSNWTGTITASNSPLVFMMQTNMVLAANFVPNPFLTRAGTYNGLFYESNAVNHARSGFFKFALTTAGAYSGNFYLGGISRTFTGKFAAGGESHLAVTTAPPVTIDFNLDIAGTSDEFHGQVAGTNWIAPLLGDRAAFLGVAPTNYTLSFLGTSDGSTSPGGDGFANATIGTNGLLTVSGRLSDDTTFVPIATSISKNGNWPFYATIYTNSGSLIGWLALGDSNIYQGNVSWIKTVAFGTNYLAGFTNEFWAMSSTRSNLTTTNRALDMTNALVILSDGGLPFSITNHVTFNSNNTLTILPGQTNGLTLALTLANGQFSGTFTNPVTHARTTLRGILMQQQNEADGFFLTPQTGRCHLQSE